MKYFLFLATLVLLTACTASPVYVTSFDECVEAGNPVMESYPRQCRHDGQLFVEQIEEAPQQSLSPIRMECSEEQKQARICTADYRPVCGLVPNGIQCVTAPCPTHDAVTFGNACSACAGQADAYYEGACEEQIFVVCQETVTGFSAEELAEDMGGICVDVCPANMDSYMTQIGVELCIVHYGAQEIAQWPVCEQSTSSCECVRTYETTDNQPIADAEYRCVPEQYASRLLFRAGLDRLDEQGEQSVMIA